MSLTAAIKRWIKRRPLGLYLVEKRKKRRYTAYLREYTDREFVQKWYRRANGGREINLEAPRLFTEKLQWLKLYYRDPMMTRCSDKRLLKEYLREQGMASLAVPTLAVYSDAETIDEKALPERFILKASHGSGWNICCDGDKDDIPWKRMKRIMALWLTESPYIYGREWNYRDQEPCVIAEPLIGEGTPIDYKWMCFNGVVRGVQVNRNINGRLFVDLYDAQWQLLDDMDTGVAPSSKEAIPRPVCYEQMKNIATALSQPFPFVRVDLYEIDGRVYCGEMTFFPGSGFWRIAPSSRDREFGDWLTLPPQNYG